MGGSARKKGKSGRTRVRNTGEFSVCGSAFFPLIGASGISAQETNGIAFAGDLGERLCANGSALCESSETNE